MKSLKCLLLLVVLKFHPKILFASDIDAGKTNLNLFFIILTTHDVKLKKTSMKIDAKLSVKNAYAF